MCEPTARATTMLGNREKNSVASYKSLVWSLAIIPTAILLLLLWISPNLVSGGNDFDASLTLSLIGVALSYYGLIFSSYAALQVQAISDGYFFKIRSPDLHKKLGQISKLLIDFGTEPSEDLRSQKFISEALVAFRSAKRVKNKHVKKVATQAEVSLNTLKERMKLSCRPGTSAGQIPEYWEFHEKVAELVDELNEQLKDARAHS